MAELVEKQDFVNFHPSKRLFVEIITQDINVHDSLLDLIDNSVDSFIRRGFSERKEIKIQISEREIKIEDNCGGLDKDVLINKVFRIGTKAFADDELETIGYYGIGLKRSIFKLGKSIIFETDDKVNYSRLNLDVDQWIKDEEEWKVPLSETKESKSTGRQGFTKITIAPLKEEIRNIITDIFINNLKESVALYYTKVIEDHLDIFINGEKITPFDLEITESDEFIPANHIEEYEGVKIQITSWVEPKTKYRQEFKRGYRGWNVFMNKRLIIDDDISASTGWNGKLLPKFHSIYNQFRGVVQMDCKNVSKLPINTKKNDFNYEHTMYHYVINKMVETSRPVINYLSRKYDEQQELIDNTEKDIENIISADSEQSSSLSTMKLWDFKEIQSFSTKTSKKPSISTVTINYKKPKKQVDILKKFLGVTSNRDVGIKSFEYVYESEGFEDE